LLLDGKKTCSCGSGCLTMGACLRGKGIRVGFCQSVKGLDATKEKRWEGELAAYRDARAQGVQPAGTTMSAVRRAMEISDHTGVAYDATNAGLV
jgi:hypothetical protein